MGTTKGDKKIKGSVNLGKQSSTPSNPTAGELKVYAKTDDKLYKLTSAGLETEVGGGGGGASAFSDLTDVKLTSVEDRDTLQYDATLTKWKNVHIALPKFSSQDRNPSRTNFFIYDGQIYTMGSNGNGLAGNYFVRLANVFSIENNLKWKDIVYNYEGAIALSTTGEVYEWGRLATVTYIPEKVSFPVGTIITSVYGIRGTSNDDEYSWYVISSAGELYAWRSNQWGQLGIGSTTYQATPQLVQGDLTGKFITKVSVSHGDTGIHVACLDSTGQAYAWGYGTNVSGNPIGNSALANNANQTTPFTIPSMTNVIDIVASGCWDGSNGQNTTRILKADGTSWASGTNFFGELANGTTTHSKVFVQESTLSTDIVKIFGLNQYISGTTAIIKSDGKLYFAGRSNDFNFGDGTNLATHTTFTNNPQLNSAGFQGKMLENGNGIIPKVSMGGSVDGGRSYTVVLDNTGTLWACGYNIQDQCGVGLTISFVTVFTKCKMPSDVPVVDFMVTGLTGANDGIMAIMQDGTIAVCGNNNFSLGADVEVNTTIKTFKYVIGFGKTN